MAHKIERTAVLDVVRQQTEPSYRVVIVWKKDYERWGAALRATVDATRYDQNDPPIMHTKNQAIIATKKS